ncbi:MAG: hypothetical protein Q4C48_09995 [Lachnospiraceae bacterium]|nr:hypothetical protein [Lachnospiraceae bacterium]
MADFFQKMNEKYVQKHFPTGSVFEATSKTLKRRGYVGVFFSGLFLAGCLFGLVSSIKSTIEVVVEGKKDMLGVALGVCGFLAVITLLFGIAFYFSVKHTRRKREDYIKLAAKASKLQESEIESFEQQAVASDTYILKLTAGLDRALSNATNKDGLLTRDYIYLASPAQIVMRVEDLKACCFNDYTYYLNTGNRSKKIHCLAITLIASNGVTDTSDTTMEAGRALMVLLKQRNAAIDVNGGNVLSEGSLDAYKKKILEG